MFTRLDSTRSFIRLTTLKVDPTLDCTAFIRLPFHVPSFTFVTLAVEWRKLKASLVRGNEPKTFRLIFNWNELRWKFEVAKNSATSHRIHDSNKRELGLHVTRHAIWIPQYGTELFTNVWLTFPRCDVMFVQNVKKNYFKNFSIHFIAIFKNQQLTIWLVNNQWLLDSKELYMCNNFCIILNS